MNILLQLAGKKIVPVVVVTILTVLTLGTSVMGMAKATTSSGTPSQQNTVTTATTGTGGGQVQAATQNTTATNGATGTTGGTLVGTKTITANNQLASNTGAGTVVAQSNTPLAGSGGCIITVFGKQYDVTKLKSTHSGGDVFSCGTDMTTQYQSQHGTNVSRLAAYLVTTNTTGGTTGTGSIQSGSGTSVSAANRCIVTIFSKQYDVTTLQSNTPGGTFACGTDMTTQYQAIHGTNVAMLQPYIVVNSSVSSGSTGGYIASSTISASSEGQNGRREIEEADDDAQEHESINRVREKEDD